MINVQKTLIASAIALASSQLIAADSYDVIDLGTLDEAPIFAMDINDSNTVVGYSYDTTYDSYGNQSSLPVHGFASENNSNIDLGAIVNANADLSVILGINNNGVAVGYSSEEYGLVDENGDPVDLDEDNVQDTSSYERAIYTTVGSDTINVVPKFVDEDTSTMRALAANNNGVLVGWGLYNPVDDHTNDGEATDVYSERPFIYDTVSDTLTRLDPLDYDQLIVKAVLRDVNDNGIAVGWSEKNYDSKRSIRSFYVDINEPDNLIDINASQTDRSSTPFAINNNNKIIGKHHIGDATRVSAYIYDISAQLLSEIPPIVEGLNAQNADNSIAYGINNSDQVVGTAIYDVVPDTYHAFLYENNKTVDLNSLIDCKVDLNEAAEGEPDWVLTEARAINDNGVIVGNGLLNSVRHAFKLVPRAGGANTCTEVEEDNSGSGSLPVWMLGLLVAASRLKRRNKI